MTRAYQLYQHYSLAELTAQAQALREDPANWTPRDAAGHPLGTLYLYTAPARRKLDAIAWAITLHLQDRHSKETR